VYSDNFQIISRK